MLVLQSASIHSRFNANAPLARRWRDQHQTREVFQEICRKCGEQTCSRVALAAGPRLLVQILNCSLHLPRARNEVNNTNCVGIWQLHQDFLAEAGTFCFNGEHVAYCNDT